MDFQGRNIDCQRMGMKCQGIGKDSQRSEMDYYQVENIDCKRSEYQGTNTNYQRQNIDLSGRNMEPHRKTSLEVA